MVWHLPDMQNSTHKTRYDHWRSIDHEKPEKWKEKECLEGSEIGMETMVVRNHWKALRERSKQKGRLVESGMAGNQNADGDTRASFPTVHPRAQDRE